MHILENWGHLLNDFESESGLLSTTRLSMFAQKIKEKGAPLDKCWSFIDCTIRQICRPSKWQRDCYNGYKHMHALKYSVVKCPDGLIYHQFGPWEGKWNDNALLHESFLLDCCQKFASGFYMYGDPAYPLSPVLLSPYSHMVRDLTENEKWFNECMSAC